MLNPLITFFGFIINYIYQVINNYGATILVFTLFTKIVLFPVNILIQKNSIKMVKIKPRLEELKLKYADDREKFMEAQIDLFDEEHYKPSLGVVPLLIQIPIILALIRVIQNTQLYISNITNTNFFGINMEEIPTLTTNVQIPILAAVTTIMLCIFQNYLNVLQKEESLISKLLTGGLTVALTVYFVFLVPSGVGLYWIAGNVLAIVQLYILNCIIPPKKYVDYEALNRIKAKKKELHEKSEREKKKAKEDYKRFFQEDNINNMHLVFYSEKNGFYKYFKGLIEYILDHSDIVIHYITGDIDDDIFNKNNPRIKPYFVTTNKLIPMFMKLEADVVVMTTPDLQNMYLKRSIVKKDIEYIMVPHGISSDNLVFRPGALDHYDTIFVNGEYSVREIRQIEKLRGTPEKKLVKYGYCNLDEMIKNYVPNEKPSNIILIAPSWQEDNIIESCIEQILDQLKDSKYNIIVRPHPETIKHDINRIKELEEKYNNIEFQKDFTGSETIYEADLIITDWSSIGLEYAFTTLKPVLYINTPMKVLNKDYQKIEEVPLDIRIRNEIGKSVDVDDISNINQYIDELIHNSNYNPKIKEIRDTTLYNVGNSSEVGGEYIINAVLRRNKAHE